MLEDCEKIKKQLQSLRESDFKDAKDKFNHSKRRVKTLSKKGEGERKDKQQ